MAAKVTFDHTERLIRPAISPVNGLITLDVQVDIYSDGKEDWLSDATLHKFRFPVSPIGGQTVSAGQLGTTYLLTDGWRIDPDLDANVVVSSSRDGQEEVFGDGGANEKVHQEIVLNHPAKISHLWATVRRVGTPTDSLRIRVHDESFADVGEFTINADRLPTAFEEIFVHLEDDVPGEAGQQLHIHFERTGTRDETNYYEIATDSTEPYTAGTAEVRNSGVWSVIAADLVIRYDEVVPYQLQINGNLFTDSGLSVAIPADNVNVQQTVSTLVEVRQDDGSAADLSLIRKILDNGLRTDPDTGKLTLYDDDGTTPIRQWDIFEDIAGTQPYRGQGSERRDAPVEL